jgi:hypothetical protein
LYAIDIYSRHFYIVTVLAANISSSTGVSAQPSTASSADENKNDASFKTARESIVTDVLEEPNTSKHSKMTTRSDKARSFVSRLWENSLKLVSILQIDKAVDTIRAQSSTITGKQTKDRARLDVDGAGSIYSNANSHGKHRVGCSRTFSFFFNLVFSSINRNACVHFIDEISNVDFLVFNSNCPDVGDL